MLSHAGERINKGIFTYFDTKNLCLPVFLRKRLQDIFCYSTGMNGDGRQHESRKQQFALSSGEGEPRDHVDGNGHLTGSGAEQTVARAVCAETLQET